MHTPSGSPTVLSVWVDSGNRSGRVDTAGCYYYSCSVPAPSVLRERCGMVRSAIEVCYIYISVPDCCSRPSLYHRSSDDDDASAIQSGARPSRRVLCFYALGYTLSTQCLTMHRPTLQITSVRVAASISIIHFHHLSAGRAAIRYAIRSCQAQALPSVP